MVCLIKPQFEAGREEVGKKGVVRDKAVHNSVVLRITDLCRTLGFEILGLTYSPIKGPEGNIEYLIYIRKNETTKTVPDQFGGNYIRDLTDEAHRQLDKT